MKLFICRAAYLPDLFYYNPNYLSIQGENEQIYHNKYARNAEIIGAAMFKKKKPLPNDENGNSKRQFKMKCCQCVVNFGNLSIKINRLTIVKRLIYVVAEAGFEPTTFGL